MSSLADPQRPHTVGDSSSPLYLGIDCSTQSLKLTVITADKAIRARIVVTYDTDLPEFGTKDGVIRDSYGITTEEYHAAKHIQHDPHNASSHAHTSAPSLHDDSLGVITSPSLMFVSALELGLTRLVSLGIPMSRIASLSVSGQQHGSVYWRVGSEQRLAHLTTDSSLTHQLHDAFTIPFGPIWMDATTRPECAAIERAVGGPEQLARLTGSSAHERFTGNQIAKLARILPGAYAATERISLISSFLPSLFIGSYAPIDAADGAGMNLMDINAAALPFEWSEQCLEACVAGASIGLTHAGGAHTHGIAHASAGGAKELRKKLGPLVDSAAFLGTVCPYFVDRYGFSPSCDVVAGSGDNPCSVSGLGLSHSGELGISLGTSDTLFAVIPTHATMPHVEAHVFPNTDDVLRMRMVMICVKNGSLVREQVKRCIKLDRPSSSHDSASWSDFNACLRSTPVGCGGRFFYAWSEPEITPHTHDGGWAAFEPESDRPIVRQSDTDVTHASQADSASSRDGIFTSPLFARGVIESQFMNLRSYAAKLGLHQPKRIVVTGGAAVNTDIIQILADVFGCDVQGHTLRDSASGVSLGPLSDTASLGAAFRARASHRLRSAYMSSALAAARHDDGDYTPTPIDEADRRDPTAESHASSHITPTITLSGDARIETATLQKPNPAHHRIYQAMIEQFERKRTIAVDAINSLKKNHPMELDQQPHLTAQ